VRARYEEYFGCEVTFGSDRNEIVFDRAQLERPVTGAQPVIASRLEPYFERALEQLTDDEVIGRVRRVIARHLERGVVSSNDTARTLGLSLRNLQRKLESAGTSYRALVDEERRGAALRLLDRPEMAIYEVAFALGYGDVGSFVRAFRRWTGEPPSEFRKRRAKLVST
jgi:AraC-like DNA-binding protein